MEDEVNNIKGEEEIILMRSLLRDGMTQSQAEEYIIMVQKELENNHKKYKIKQRRQAKNKKINQHN